MTINGGVHSPIYTRQRIFFSPCGTMFPHDTYHLQDVDARQALDSIRTVEIKTRVSQGGDQ